MELMVFKNYFELRGISSRVGKGDCFLAPRRAFSAFVVAALRDLLESSGSSPLPVRYVTSPLYSLYSLYFI